MGAKADRIAAMRSRFPQAYAAGRQHQVSIASGRRRISRSMFGHQLQVKLATRQITKTRAKNLIRTYGTHATMNMTKYRHHGGIGRQRRDSHGRFA